MPLATSCLITLHFFQATMTSTQHTSKGASTSRGGGNKRTTMLRIPGPSNPDGADDNTEGKVLRAGFGKRLNPLCSSPQDDGSDSDNADLVRDPALPGADRDQNGDNKVTVSQDVFSDVAHSSQHDAKVVRDRSDLVDKRSVSRSDVNPANSRSSITRTGQSTGENIGRQASVAGIQESEIVPVLKRKDSSKDKTRSSSMNRTVSLSEPADSKSHAREDSKSSSVSSTFSDTCDDSRPTDGSSATTTPHTPAVSKRRISFPADSVLTAVIQDGDTAELVKILTGRHGPGLVQSRGEGGVMRGVDVCQTNHVGLTALHHAVLANNLDAAKLLLCHGADVNAQDVHGFSPLHTAAACGFLPLTTLLLLYGADVFSQTLEHELPIDVAKELRIVRVLSAEMTRLVHQELWVASFIRARAEESWLLLRKLLACVLLFVIHVCVCVRTSWRKRHRKTD